jgi:1,2-diacylglycerol 3-beta-galactosyltransferase
MIHRQPDIPHIVFLFSDTGGGHRSATEAIIEAINTYFPNQVSTDMVDIFREYFPPPLSSAPEIYPPLSRMPNVWRLGYRASDGRHRTELLDQAFWPYIRRSIYKLLEENPCDLLVSVHPLINAPMVRGLKKFNCPYVTVVTDMVSTHSAWYSRKADLIIVPTELARQTALVNGIGPDQVKVIGLPVAQSFCKPFRDKEELKKAQNWPTDRPAILLVGGGEGMGPLEEVARSINEADLPASLIIITGRNRELKKHLENLSWNMPTYVYGFVHNMPDLMGAADAIITKAGPGTISEAFIAGLPIILYNRLPGQEEGNVAYVVEKGAGVWAPQPELVTETLKNWVYHSELMRKTAGISAKLARPDAAKDIAQILIEKAVARNPQEIDQIQILE